MSIRIENLSKSFGAQPVLHALDLAIGDGELVALLGPSGSGKTTLLRVVGGLEQATQGRVCFDGEDVSGWPIQQRKVGFVFQHYALFQHMSVFENVAFGLRARPRAERLSESALHQRVRELLALVQLSEFELRHPGKLSGGQQQRVALARALAIDPRVLLLDEPFGALDAQVRKELRAWVRAVHEQTRLTTLFVTHDQDEALELADRVVVLRDGRIEQIGTPDEIYDEPATRFVHGFVGESSSLRVQVCHGRLCLGDQALDLIVGRDIEGEHDLVFRPQHVQWLEAGQGGLAARLLEVLRVGPRFRVGLDCQGQRIHAELDARPGVAPGALVHIKPTRWRLYRRESPQAVARENRLEEEQERPASRRRLG